MFYAVVFILMKIYSKIGKINHNKITQKIQTSPGTCFTALYFQIDIVQHTHVANEEAVNTYISLYFFPHLIGFDL